MMDHLTRFHKILYTAIFLIVIYLLSSHFLTPAPVEPLHGDEKTLHVFYMEQCQHCKHAMEFLGSHSPAGIKVEYININLAGGRQSLVEFSQEYHVSLQDIRLPLFVFGNNYRMGFDNPESSGKKLLEWVSEYKVPEVREVESITLPVIGEIQLTQYSLPALAVILGLADGFNPCAMWVLVYMLTIIISLRDKSRIWMLVGIFVLTSGVFYYVLMAAWLNFFIFIGYIKLVTQLIGLFSLAVGISQLYEIRKSEGNLTCHVGDAASHQRVKSRIKNIVSSSGNLLGIGAMIGLAISVNAIEFVCSSALPAIYTHVLSVSHVTGALYYWYIFIYVFFFMLDDLIVFGTAAFAAQVWMDSKYAVYSQCLGAVILTGLGVWLLLGA